MKCDGQKWEKKFSKIPFRAKQCNFNVGIMYKSWTWSHHNMPGYITMWPRVRVKNSTIATCPVLTSNCKRDFCQIYTGYMYFKKYISSHLF